VIGWNLRRVTDRLVNDNWPVSFRIRCIVVELSCVMEASVMQVEKC